MITQEDIQLVNSRMEIVDIVSQFVKLRKRGGNYIGNCPFHNEKTGSFTVSPAKQIYKCFGCGKAGNPITFVMEHEKYSYPDAVKWIAAKYNIEIQEAYRSDEDRQRATETESMFLLNKIAGDYFKSTLLQHKEALSYVKDRGLSDKSIEDFGIGYSHNDNGLYNLLVANQYNIDIASSLGLVRINNNRAYDIYSERIIFPIQNLSGKIIAFGGRITTGDKTKPKYINSPENPIYHKGDVLYGLYQAKQSIAKQDEALLVEGYTDVISLFQNEITNVVASSGTALTDNQVRLIRRFSKNIVFVYDGDAAGLKAIKRGMEIALENSISIRAVILPDGEDPDSFVKANGKDATTSYIEKNKIDLIEFYHNISKTQSADDKDATLKELFTTISKVAEDNFFKKKFYFDKTCELFGITKSTANAYYNSVSGAQHAQQEQQPQVEQKREPKLYERERELTKLLLKFGERDYYDNQLVCNVILDSVDHIGDNYYKPNKITATIHEEYIKAMQEGEIPTHLNFITSEDNDIRSFVSDTIIEDDLISLNWKENIASENIDYRDQVRLSLGLYYINYHKMLLYVLHNKVDKTSPEWSEDIINNSDKQFRNNIINKAKELGLNNFKF